MRLADISGHAFGLCLVIALILLPTLAATQTPVIFGVETDTGNDTLVVGQIGRINFTVDANGLSLLALTFPMSYQFSNGNIIGPLQENVTVFRAPGAANFESFGWGTAYENATDPDTTLCGFIDIGGTRYVGSGAVWYIEFVPLDSGTIRIDSTKLPPDIRLAAADDTAQELPLQWQAKTLTVVLPCPIPLTGDVTHDGTINAADIVRTVCLAFICDFPYCDHVTGDVNCSGTLTAADIIYLVIHVFKGGPPPCDVCTLIWDGTVTAPTDCP